MPDSHSNRRRQDSRPEFHDTASRHGRIARAIACAIVATGIALGAQSGVRQGAAPKPELPAHETPSDGAGTAVIRGTVLAGDTGSPLRAATVTLVANGRTVRVVASDRDGRYVFRDVMAGRYAVVARRSGYVPWAHGQRSEGLPGRTLDVGSGQQLAAIEITLPRNSAIIGRITDEYGAPLSDVRVRAWRARVIGSRRRLVAAGATRESDDLGQYRLFGLGPGEYYVTAVPKTPGEDDTDDVGNTNYALTFYPGTLNSAEAERVNAALGQEVVADFPLVPSIAVTVSGSVRSHTGRPPSGGSVELLPRRDLAVGVVLPGQYVAQIGTGGGFTARRVPPGTYAVVALTTGTSTGPFRTEPEGGTRLITVDQRDVPGVEVLTTPGTVLAGRITVDGVRPAFSPEGVRVTAVPASPDEPEGAIAIPPAPVRADWTFELRGVLGHRLLGVLGLPPAYAVRVVTIDGQDITDTGFAASPRPTATVEIELTGRLTEVTGTARDGVGRPGRDYVVLCFAADGARRTHPQGRYLRLVRSDQHGRYSVAGLPAGSYLIVAVEDLQAGALDEPGLYDRLRDMARPVTLVEGTSKAVDLPLRQD